MKQLHEEYAPCQFLPSPTAELPAPSDQSPEPPIGQSLTAQLPETWFNISFTHHMLLISKCQSQEERFFYIDLAATQFWSVRILEHHINSNLFKHQGKVPNNFNNTLPENLKADALQVFRDNYLFDFVTEEEGGDEFFIDLLFFNRLPHIFVNPILTKTSPHPLGPPAKYSVL